MSPYPYEGLVEYVEYASFGFFIVLVVVLIPLSLPMYLLGRVISWAFRL
jgi:hypothetical protein